MVLLGFIVAFIISVFFTLTVLAQNLEEETVCLSEALYFEARSESFIAQLAVGNVIYNRVKSSKFPNTFCEVVHQANKTRQGKLIKHKCQFSYYCDGKEEKIYNKESYKTVTSVSHLIIEGVSIESLRDALYYHAVYVTPYWVKDKMYLGNLGLHKFYK